MTLEKLNEHLELLQKKADIEELITNLWDAASPGAQDLNGMPHGGTPKDKVGDLAIEIADLNGKLKTINEEVHQSEMKILPFINSICDDRTRMIFRLRYIHGLPWRSVAATLGPGITAATVRQICYRYTGEA